VAVGVAAAGFVFCKQRMREVGEVERHGGPCGGAIAEMHTVDEE
jgi:hypothetical protein